MDKLNPAALKNLWFGKCCVNRGNWMQIYTFYWFNDISLLISKEINKARRSGERILTYNNEDRYSFCADPILPSILTAKCPWECNAFSCVSWSRTFYTKQDIQADRALTLLFTRRVQAQHDLATSQIRFCTATFFNQQSSTTLVIPKDAFLIIFELFSPSHLIVSHSVAHIMNLNQIFFKCKTICAV